MNDTPRNDTASASVSLQGTGFATALLAWHARHGRHNLPWQRSRDPYRVWLSEIMLQQTRVDTVIPYYTRFLDHFPTLEALAAAETDAVLALWSGLGYYARARNLHRAACVIVQEHQGKFPRDSAGLATLPGIGRSTAAAIAAFSFGERAPILDGNVKRVLCRAFGIDGFPGDKAVETRLWSLAESLLPERDHIGRYTQAQMDLGATVCTRSRPRCEACPLASGCEARRTGRVSQLPAPRPRKALPTRTARLAVIRAEGRILVEKRPPSGIWGGLYSLPELPAEQTGAGTGWGDWLAAQYGMEVGDPLKLQGFVHAFTHFRLAIEPLLFDLNRPPALAMDAALRWLEYDALDAAGLPAPVRRIIDGVSQEDLFTHGGKR